MGPNFDKKPEIELIPVHMTYVGEKPVNKCQQYLNHNAIVQAAQTMLPMIR